MKMQAWLDSEAGKLYMEKKKLLHRNGKRIIRPKGQRGRFMKRSEENVETWVEEQCRLSMERRERKLKRKREGEAEKLAQALEPDG